MNRKISILILVIVTSFMINVSARSLSDKFDSRSIDFDLDNPFVIELFGTPTTNYTITLISFIPNVEKMIGKPDSKLFIDLHGLGGLYTFNFKTFTSGQITLKLVLYKYFIENYLPARTYIYVTNKY